MRVTSALALVDPPAGGTQYMRTCSARAFKPSTQSLSRLRHVIASDKDVVSLAQFRAVPYVDLNDVIVVIVSPNAIGLYGKSR